jgi:hypothetical protein
MEEASELYKVAMLVDQLKHEDEAQRVAASKCLVRIAKVLGPERTREELLPFLAESQGDEDAVLAVIAEKLGELVDCVGGNAYAHVLLVPLEPLVAIDDAAVRAAAIVSVETIASAMSDAQIASELVPCVLNLASKDWFTSRISAALLVAVAHSRCCRGGFDAAGAEAAANVGKAFLKLCADDTPMVRRVAAGQLFKLAESASAQGGDFDDAGSLLSNLLDTVIHLAGTCCLSYICTVTVTADVTSTATSTIIATVVITTTTTTTPPHLLTSSTPTHKSDDEQDNVRIQAIPNLLAIGTLVPEPVRMKRILPVVKNRAEDR